MVRLETLREQLQRQETLEEEIQCTRVCEDAAFLRSLHVGMSYKTILDVDDGFGEDPHSKVYATIPGQTTIGPVLQVHITRYLDISGIEIQIPSKRFKILGDDMQRQKSLRGRVTSQ